MSILMLINLKGGVAKTTSAVAIAECLASEGHRTLLIDADHQCMAGELLLGETRQFRCEQTKRNLHHMMAAMLKPTFMPNQFEQYITRKVSNIDGGLSKLSVLPCSILIDGFSRNMRKGRREYTSNAEYTQLLNKRRKQLRKWAETNFDYTIIDCPPSLALQVHFLLSVADAFIIPSVPDRLSVRGSLHLIERLKSHSFKISPMGTLWSLYREQIAGHKGMVKEASLGSERLGKLPRPFATIIPHAAKISEACESGGNPKSFSKKYTPEFAKLFKALCGEVVERAELQRQNPPVARASVSMLAERPRVAIQRSIF